MLYKNNKFKQQWCFYMKHHYFMSTGNWIANIILAVWCLLRREVSLSIARVKDSGNCHSTIILIEVTNDIVPYNI